jgi:hypothetical protein
VAGIRRRVPARTSRGPNATVIERPRDRSETSDRGAERIAPDSPLNWSQAAQVNNIPSRAHPRETTRLETYTDGASND